MTMAAIYDTNGEAITEGLQGCFVCDEAASLAKEIAKERGTLIYLNDDDGEWTVEWQKGQFLWELVGPARS
jgi:hypothetical protein